MSYVEDDTIEGELITRASSDSVVGSIARAEVDMQISTAKQFPRSVKRFLTQVRELVTLNEDVAGECMYALPRGGKTIEGPSARFAEVVLSCWGNSHGAARVVGEDDKFVTAQAVVWDLERNVRVTFETRRRITNKGARRFDDDMIGVTGNAAASIAFRNAVLKVVPKAFWNGLYEEARKCAIGDVKTLATKRAAALANLGKMGVTEPMVLALLEKQGVDDIGLDELAVLRGVYTAIKDEGASIESIFNKPVEGARVAKSTIAPKTQATKAPSAPPPAESPAAGNAASGARTPPGEESQEVGDFEDAGAGYGGPDDAGEESQEADVYRLILERCEDAAALPGTVRAAIADAKACAAIDQRQADELEMALQRRIDRVRSKPAGPVSNEAQAAVARGKARKQQKGLIDEPGDGGEAYGR
jgi:hypothetical protein